MNFDGITYAKGASVLRQLVAYVGEQEFVAGLRQYFKAHAYGNTELVDLLRELEATSGRDLRQWSAQWLERSQVNTLRPLVEVDTEGRISALAIEQTAVDEHPVLRPHRLAVGCYDLEDGRLRRTDRIELDVDGPATQVPQLVGRAQPDLLLVNDDDLAYAKVRLDERSLATALEHLEGFSSSMPRMLVLGAVWDMTRDGEAPATAYVELALKAIATESDSTVLRVLLAQLSTSSRLYTAAANRPRALTRAADALLGLLRSAPGGSDQQLQLTTAFAGYASTDEHIGFLRGLYDGTAPLDGLAVDADMRWTLLTALVCAGAAGQAEVDAELERDATASGRRFAAQALAARPTPEAKLEAWQSVVDRGDLPNALQESTIVGFGRLHDPELLRPFVERYFACLERVWSERTSDTAQSIVVGLYPTALADATLVAASDAWLTGHPAAPAALRRLVAENRDTIARAVRVQERDAQG